jgi:hypothetical protein
LKSQQIIDLEHSVTAHFIYLNFVGHNPKSIPANILNKQNQIFLSHSPQIPAQKREVSDAEERKGLKH